MTGIYQIKSIKNNKIYIGSAVYIKNRWALHIKSLSNKKHHSIHLQRHVNKYGINDLEFSILEVCNKVDLLNREQFYINNLNPEFNICKIAGSSFGVKRSDKTKEKIRQANLGLKHPEWRNEIKSKAQGGENHWTKNKKNPFSLESKLKMSKTHKELYKNGYIHPKNKSIIQYDLNGNFIKEWKSISDAKKVYGNGIQNNLNNKSKTAYGFKWKYKEKE